MGERQFTEQQVADIIRRATTAHSRESRVEGGRPGMINASEVKRIAQELGIDALAIENAMQETSSWAANDSGTLKSVDRTLERKIEGELADEDYALILEEFVPSSGPGSQSISVGSTLNYKAMAGLAECSVSVSKKSGWTNLRCRTSAYLALVPTMIPALLASIISGGIVWESRNLATSEKLITHLLILAAVWSLALWAFKSAVLYSNRKIAGIMDRTAAKVAETTGEGKSVFVQSLESQIESTTETEQELRLQD